MRACYENAHNIACPQNAKIFISKTRMSQKETCACRFGPFWAILSLKPLLHVPKTTILVSKINGLLILGHASAPPHWRLLHPLKTVKHLFWKQGCPKKGHASPDPSPVAPPENGKSFFYENTNAQKRTIVICQISITFDKFIKNIVTFVKHY